MLRGGGAPRLTIPPLPPGGRGYLVPGPHSEPTGRHSPSDHYPGEAARCGLRRCNAGLRATTPPRLMPILAGLRSVALQSFHRYAGVDPALSSWEARHEMAIFQPLLGNMRGSVAANTWSHNRGGTYVRRRSVPVNPNSTRQQLARGILAELSATWSALGQSDRDAWTTWAAGHPTPNALGEVIQLTGQQAYISLNARLLDAGGTAIANPPVANSPGPFATVTGVLDASDDDLELVFTATPLPAGSRVYAWMCAPGNAGQDPNFRQARLIGYSAAAAASPATFATLPFVIVAGQVVNVWVGIMDQNGQISVPEKLRLTVQA